MHYSTIEVYKAQAAESECTLMNQASEMSEKTVQILIAMSEQKSIATEITENVIPTSELSQQISFSAIFCYIVFSRIQDYIKRYQLFCYSSVYQAKFDITSENIILHDFFSDRSIIAISLYQINLCSKLLI